MTKTETQFQSTPPPKRRETQVGRRRLPSPVSIHSPRRSEGRRGTSDKDPSGYGSFNPLPPPKRPAIFPHLVLSVSIHSPRRSEGRLTRVEPSEWRDDVSIHSPRRSEGRHRTLLESELDKMVSIHSPRRSEGRPVAGILVAKLFKFQSTPPAEARGDRLPPSCAWSI